jgi:hypothetical protein
MSILSSYYPRIAGCVWWLLFRVEYWIHWLRQMVLCFGGFSHQVELILHVLSAGIHWLPQMVLCVEGLLASGPLQSRRS